MYRCPTHRDHRAGVSPAGLLSLGLLAVALFLLPGCSVRKFAVNKLGDALASGGGGFSSDDDPELVRDAAPFSLKLMESLLAEAPGHVGLRTASASGFTQYAFAFLQQQADELESKDLAAAEALRARARGLYLRAHAHGLRGLEARHRGFEKALQANPTNAVKVATRADVPLLYWTAASWGAAIALSKDNPALVGELPKVEALIYRACQLNESYDQGALHSFLITFEMSRTGAPGDPVQRARQHLERALALANGKQAGPYLSFAESVCIQKQDAKEFESLLNKALAIQPDQDPDHRLVNIIMQRRARWLLSKKDDLFVPPLP